MLHGSRDVSAFAMLTIKLATADTSPMQRRPNTTGWPENRAIDCSNQGVAGGFCMTGL